MFRSAMDDGCAIIQIAFSKNKALSFRHIAKGSGEELQTISQRTCCIIDYVRRCQ